MLIFIPVNSLLRWNIIIFLGFFFLCPWDLLSNPVMLLYILNDENKTENSGLLLPLESETSFVFFSIENLFS